MKGIHSAAKATPAAAVMTALASVACCLPWGIGALLGSAGLAIALERRRVWLIAMSLVFLALGAFSLFRTSRSCRRLPRAFTILLSVAAILVFAIAEFPD
jgi:cytochrome bd-type quinol oxidase subunit 2